MNRFSWIAVLCELGAIVCAVLYLTDVVSRFVGAIAVAVLVVLFVALSLGSLVFAIMGMVGHRESKRLAWLPLVFTILATIAIVIAVILMILQSIAENGLGG